MTFVKPFCIVATSLGLAACADTTRPGAEMPMSVSFSTGATAGASFSRSAVSPSFDVTTTQGTNTLVITKAQLVVARMELAQVGATCSSTEAAGDDERDDHERSECAELTLTPTIVDLPVNDAVVSTLAVTIPAGTYTALEAKIRAIRGTGLIWGVDTHEPAGAIIERARQAGLLLVSAGEHTLRFLPPLVITQDELARGLAILEGVLRDAPAK